MIIGLTGGIGSGKSTVARLFTMFGCAHFESDEAARSTYFIPAIKAKITALLGDDAYQSENEINRSFISEKIFGKSDLLSAVNKIIHPAVAELFRDFVSANNDKIILKESALLYEANVTAGLDKIVVVAAPDELRISRVMKRDNITEHEVKARMKKQLPQEQKINKADFVIWNDEKHLLIEQVERIFNSVNK